MKKTFLFVPFVLATLNISEAKIVDGVRAVVQDRPILFSDVSERVKAVKGSPSLAQILNVSASTFTDERALDLLIEEKIILASAKALGAEPTEAEINKQIAVIAGQNRLSVENLKKSLRDEKIDFDLYKANIGVQLAKRSVIEKELRASNSAQSDQELKNYYERNLPDEVDVAMIRKPANKVGMTTLRNLRAQLNKAGRPLASLLKANKAAELGWNDPSALNESFQSALAKTDHNAIASEPFVFNRAAYILVIKGRRKGSAENFETAKEQVRQQLQGKDLEERFNAWIEQKKKTMNIVVNKA